MEKNLWKTVVDIFHKKWENCHNKVAKCHKSCGIRLQFYGWPSDIAKEQ